METEKKQRLLYAGFVTSIILLLLLIVVAVCQVVKISNGKKYLNSLKSEKRALELKYEKCENEIEKWELEEAIREKAMMLGYVDGEE